MCIVGEIGIQKLRKSVELIIIGILLLSFSCSHFGISKKPISALNGLENVKSYAVVYAKKPITKYKPFDLLILEGENYNKFEIHELRKSNKIVLAYLNVGEIESYRPYFNEVKSSWYIEINEDWPDHYFVNPAQKGWRNLLKKTVIPPLLEKGFQGFLFDSVDLASQSRFPEYHFAMAKLIKSLHKSFPEAMIILNNGGFLLGEVANSVHGLLIEEVFTERINEHLTSLRTKEVFSPILENLANVKQRWNIPTFIIEYFPTEQTIPKEEIFIKSQKVGLIPYLTDQYAQQVYEDYVKFKNDKVQAQDGVMDVSGDQ